MSTTKTTAKDFFFWFGAIIAFYWSVIAFIFLIFHYIDVAFPNALSYVSNPYDGGMPYEMASLIVLLPIFAVLMTFIRRDIATDTSRKETWVRRWGIILTLFIAGVTIAIDVITLLTSFLSGNELTTAFLLKVLLILLVAAAVFMHFIADLRGYWDANRRFEKIIFGAVGILVLLSIGAGFLIVGTPRHAREMRFDTQRVTDLQSIQGEVVNYWQSKQTLPKDLPQLVDSVGGYRVPADPSTGTSYEYTTTGSLSFELCATFTQSGNGSDVYAYPIGTKRDIGSWAHESGHVCFSRTIDSSLYPPFRQTR